MFSFCSSLPQHQTDLSALHHFFASLVLMPILTQSFPPFPAFHFLLCHFHYQITSSFPGIQTTIFLKSLFQSSSSSEDPWQYILSTIKLQKPAHKKSCKNVLKHLVGTDFQRPLILLSVFELHRQFSTYKTDYWEFTQGQVWRRWMGNNDSPYSQYKNAMEGWALKQEERVFLLWDTWHSETPQCQGKSKRLKEKNQTCLEEEIHWWPLNTKEPPLSQPNEGCLGTVSPVLVLSASSADHYLENYTWLSGALQQPC